MSDPSNQAKAIFLAALEEHAPEQWPAFLEQACAGDARLRAEVEKLLRALEMGSFHEPPRPAALTVDEPVSERPGTVIGPYKLLQQLGEGGMGTVFLAEQTQPVQRKVALKIIKPGMDSRQVIARFEAERQALALMDHPNIARVLDAGTTANGRPYFVMELVKGVPITKYCDEHRLTPKQRLELFVPVCQAVQHAHQKGIIHRDIKPSNVLVALYDGKPVPKVIDFGIAKATGPRLTDKTLFTEIGSVVGTLEYMSPEQAELNQLDIDTRSDIYSLGVLLYELLTGSTPLERKRFQAAAFLEVLRLIREEESPRPSTRLSTTEGLPSIAANRGLEPKKLSGLVRGELDWIVMKTLEKDRNRRYETANGFAQDIQRYLADEPVQACPPSAGYRLRKFARRNKTALATVGVVAAALVLGTVISTWQAIRATTAEGLAEDRLVSERAAREALDAAREEKEQQRTRINRELSEAFVEAVRLRQQAEKARPGDSAAWNQLLETLRRTETLAKNELADHGLLGRVQAFLAEMKQTEADRRMLARLEDIRLNKGNVAGVAGLSPHALESRGFTARDLGLILAATRAAYQAAFRDYGLPIFDLPVEEAARRLAGSSLRDRLLVALEDCVSIDGDWKPRLLPIARRAVNDPWHQRYFDARLGIPSESLLTLAREPETLAQPPAMLCMLAERIWFDDLPTSVKLLREAQRRQPADLWTNFDLALVLLMTSRVATSREDAARYLDESVGFVRAALAVRPEKAIIHWALGELLRARGDLDGSIAAFRQTTELDPQDSWAYGDLADALRARGDMDNAIVASRKAIELAPKNLAFYRNLGKALLGEKGTTARYAPRIKPYILGLRRDYSQQDGDTVAAYRKALELYPHVAEVHCALGNALVAIKDWPGALLVFREAITVDPKHAKTYYRDLGQALVRKQQVLNDLNKEDLDVAIAAFANAKEAVHDHHVGVAYEMRLRANKRLGLYSEALADARMVQKFWADERGVGEIALARELANCPNLKLRDAGQAVELSKKAVQMSPQVGGFWTALGIAQYRAGDLNAAVAALKKSIECRNGIQVVNFLFLAMAQDKLGQHDEARIWYNRALGLIEETSKSLSAAGAKDAVEELSRFRNEAEEVLELKKK